MKRDEFESLLSVVVERLTAEGRGSRFGDSKEFEERVRAVIKEVAHDRLRVDLQPHPQAFPDIVLGDLGVEVKFTTGDSWRCVANSVFEGTKSVDVKMVYLVYGKMGGTPEVKWGRWSDCVVHVRTSHVPRFEVEIDAPRSLFETMGVTYDEFSALADESKMRHVRAYARGRLKEGERLWWLGDDAGADHSVPVQLRLYSNLDDAMKRRLRAEATLLCPKIFGSSPSKYFDIAHYFVTYHGVLAPQTRDLFTAGSVAGVVRKEDKRGGVYLMRATIDLQPEILEAARRLSPALFAEYWRGERCGPRSIPKTAQARVREWLAMADSYAKKWTPSRELFQELP